MDKDINFLPAYIVKSRIKRRNLYILALVVVTYLAVLGWALYMPMRAVAEYQSRLSAVERELEALEPAREVYEEKQQLKEKLAAMKSALKDIEAGEMDVTFLLEEINSVLPVNCFISYLSLKGREEFTVDIVTGSPVDTAAVQVGLRKTDLFENVDLAGAGSIPLDEGQHIIRFKLKLSREAYEKYRQQKQVLPAGDV